MTGESFVDGHRAEAVTARLAGLGAARAAQATEMTEAGLMAAVRGLTRAMGHRVYHTARSDRSDKGFPDLVIVGPGGIAYRELKRESGRVTAEQACWLHDLRAAGADADVWRPSDLLTGRVAATLTALRGPTRASQTSVGAFVSARGRGGVGG